MTSAPASVEYSKGWVLKSTTPLDGDGDACVELRSQNIEGHIQTELGLQCRGGVMHRISEAMNVQS